MGRFLRIGGILLLAFGLAPMAMAQDNAGPASKFLVCPGTEVVLSFDAAGDAFVFDLAPTGNGKVKVSVADCCVFGPDIYRISLFEVGKPGRSKVTNGVVDDFSGTIKKGVQVGKSYKVIISPDSVLGGFGAGATACFEGPVTVTGPLAE